ncbi:DUF3048 domain-containing protein [Rossellomorea vietnamensis]|uniref:DUF3048 domain-containing protein n=1 Tax=Rossellomorea vietnamensis TaxID=218284 RepID=A0A5D4M688_9BACI|nr:DUF3048 domain-containing protein [Rossellomorea vietnamensis]TYR96515.1 DUF3048 domain-containing protein [Rossellomorea vietnamensis]
MWKKTAIAAMAALLLTACSSDNETAENNDNTAKNNTEQNNSVDQDNNDEAVESQYEYPLTGVSSDEESSQRAVAVVVNNHPIARPQSGLDHADIVYEVLAEGNVTRFVALFQSEQPETVGPVRSARDYFIELAEGYDSFFVAHGYSPKAKELLASGSVDNINGMVYDGSLFKRADFRKAPHNSYISFENIEKGAEDTGAEMDTPPEPLEFAQSTEAEGEDAASVEVSYYDNPSFSPVYEYDQGTEKYKRVSEGEELADYDTGDPVLLDNIFIIEAPHAVVDDAGRRDIDLTSGGNAYLLQKGKLLKVEWENQDGRIVPAGDAGLLPGKTWINIIPDNPGLDKFITVQ